MKSSIRTIFVILAIVMGFVLVQGVWAEYIFNCEYDVAGTICEMTKRSDGEPSSIEVLVGEGDCETGETVVVYGIPFDKLERDDYKSFEIGEYVEIKAHECPLSNAGGQLKVCTIDGIDIFYFNQDGNLKPKNKTAADATGDCCPECPGCDPIEHDYDYNHNYVLQGPHGNNF